MPKKKKTARDGVFFESDGKFEFLEQKYIDALIELGLIVEVDSSGKPTSKSKNKKPKSKNA